MRLVAMQAEATAAVDDEVRRLAPRGVGWGEIGRALAVSRQAAPEVRKQRYWLMSEPTRVIPSYTRAMKTAISVPDAIFEESTKRARQLGISRSEFFSTAARRYLDELTRESLTRQIDQALDLPSYDDDASAVAASAGRARLSDDDW
jgi:hypothetical protein